MKKVLPLFTTCAILSGCFGSGSEEYNDSIKDHSSYHCHNQTFDPNSVRSTSEVKYISCDIENFTNGDLSGLALFENLESLSIENRNQSPDKVVFDSDWTPKLKSLYLDTVKFETFSLSAMKEVERISIYYSEMPEINVTNLSMLTHLIIGNTNLELETLDLSYNPEIQLLLIRNTNIKDLTFANNDKLSEIILEAVNSRTIELINLPSLRILSMYDGVLEKLYIDLPSLEYASIYNNKLTSVDFSGSPELSGLALYDNLITDINVDVNEKLTRLDLTGNPLSEKTKAYLDTLTWIEDLKY